MCQEPISGPLLVIKYWPAELKGRDAFFDHDEYHFHALCAAKWAAWAVEQCLISQSDIHRILRHCELAVAEKKPGRKMKCCYCAIGMYQAL